MRRKVTPMKAIFGHKIPKRDLNDVKEIYKVIEGRPERIEFNIYISGRDEDIAESPQQRVGAPAASDGNALGAEPGSPAS